MYTNIDVKQDIQTSKRVLVYTLFKKSLFLLTTNAPSSFSKVSDSFASEIVQKDSRRKLH